MVNYGGRGCVNPVAHAPAIDARAVTARYPGSRLLAIDCVSLCAQPGERVALVGPNGAGKSSLLKAAAGLLKIDGGTISIYGNQVAACHHRVAYLPQRSEVDWRFPITVRRLALTGRYVHLGWLRWPGRADWAAADQSLDRLNLRDLAERQIGELSGGQQQRALLARALTQDADLLLLDEPMNAVDGETREVISAALRDAQRAGKTAIVATHHVDDLASGYDSVLRLADGRMVAA
jgi:manganese/zinc/iron transport system ATP- binding protein